VKDKKTKPKAMRFARNDNQKLHNKTSYSQTEGYKHKKVRQSIRN